MSRMRRSMALDRGRGAVARGDEDDADRTVVGWNEWSGVVAGTHPS